MFNTWVVVADRRKAKICEVKGLPLKIHQVDQIELPVHVVADYGANYEEWNEAVAERFSADMGNFLTRARRAGKFEKLILIAEPHLMNSLKKKIDHTTACLIIGEITKNLIHSPMLEIERYVDDLIERDLLHPAASSFY